MSKARMWLAGPAAGLALIGGIAVVAAGPASATAKQFTVLVTAEGSHTDVDATDNGANFDPGDSFVENTLVKDEGGTKTIGHADTVVTFLDSAGEFQITCTVIMGADKILFEGGGNFSELATGFVVPVTGGTGNYSKARGTVTLQDLGGGLTRTAFKLNGD